MRHQDPPVALTTTPVLRKKGTGVRTWLSLDSMGQAQVIEAGKYAIMRRTGLPARDLRVLDPFLSYPSTVLGRERAIVINLEHIKAIIMAKEVLLLNFKDPFVGPLVEELQKRVLCHYQAIKAQDNQGDNINLLESELEIQSKLIESKKSSGGLQLQDKEEGKHAVKNQDGSTVLPFELIALEACLEATCNSLENDAKTLELEAYPTLDKLTSKVSTLNLERARQIKSRLVVITGRVEKVRNELEHLLDDDEDMAEMYLTDKLAQRNFELSSNSSTKYEDFAETNNITIPPEILESSWTSAIHGVDIRDDDDSGDDNDTDSEPNPNTTTKNFDVGELEMLLEAYFVQIDGVLNKLTTLREYVDDTEDYINIMLDDKQNQLLQMGVMLSTATLILSVFIVLAGILGMNIRIQLFLTSVQEGMPKWLWTTGASVVGCVVLYAMAIAWYKFKRYL